jgi:hypothetical protein
MESPFVDSAFVGTKLTLAECDAAVASNRFELTEHPLEGSSHPDLSKVAFAGSDSNILLGEDAELVVAFAGVVP